MIVWELLMELMFMHLFQFKYKEGFAVERNGKTQNVLSAATFDLKSLTY